MMKGQGWVAAMAIAANRNSLGTESDRLLSDNSSVLRLSQNLGIDFILQLTIGSLAQESRTIKNADLGIDAGMVLD